jgi:hypothetical protein
MSNKQNDHFHETVKENTLGKEDVLPSIAYESELSKELETLTPKQFMEWLYQIKQEVK